jgi:hypothetical protein
MKSAAESLLAETKDTMKYKVKTERETRGWEQHIVLDDKGTPVVRTVSYHAGSEESQSAFLWLWQMCLLYNEAQRDQQT